MAIINRTLLLILLLTFSHSLLCAQENTGRNLPVEKEYGQVSDSLLALDSYPEFPDAPYYFDFKSVEINFLEKNNSIIARMSYLVRIKILTEEGRQGAEVGIPYYFDRNIEQITNIRAQTHQPNGDLVPLDTAEIVTVNLNSRYNVKRFLMPDAKPGSVLEYTYTIERKFIEELPDFQLSHPVPTDFAQVVLNNPKYLRYEVVGQGIGDKLFYKKNFIDTSTAQKIFTVPQPEPMLQEVWAAEDLKPIVRNKLAGSYNEQVAQLKFQLSEFGRPRQPLEISWDYIVASMRRRANPWENIEKYPELDSLGKEIAQNFSNKVAAQDSIYRYVNEVMKYNENNGNFTGNNLNEVLDGEFSTKSAINLTLLGILRGAGIEAYPLFLSSRQFGSINKDFPSIFQFNSLLVYSEIDGTPYFMDASYSHGSIGLIPTDNFNESGLVFQNQGFKWVDIQPAKSKFYISLDIDASLDQNGNLAGTVDAKNEGYTAREIRKMKHQGLAAEEIVKQSFFDIYSDAEIRNATIDIDPETGIVRINSQFVINEYAVSFQSGLEFRPLISGFLLDNPLQDDIQNMTVHLDAPEILMLDYSIAYPPGYRLDDVNADRQIMFPGAEFQEKYNTKEDTVSYSYNIEISKRKFPPDVFPQILNLYERWVSLSKSKWFIKKE